MIALTQKQRDQISELIGENVIIEITKDSNVIWNCQGFENSFAEKNSISGQFGNINIDEIVNQIFLILGKGE